MTADDVVTAFELAFGFKLLAVPGLIHDRGHHLRADSTHFQMPKDQKLHDSFVSLLKKPKNASTTLSMNGKILPDFNHPSVRHFDKLSAGSETLEG
jgi:hypothetical protein